MLVSRYCYGGLIALEVASLMTDVPVLVHMLAATLLTIAGASETACQLAQNGGEDSSVETMSKKDAYMFPVMGSIMLFSLYICFKYLPEYYVDLLVKVYFFALGSIALAETALMVSNKVLNINGYSLLSFVIGGWLGEKLSEFVYGPDKPPKEGDKKSEDKKKAEKQGPKQFNVNITTLNFPIYILSIATGLWNMLYDHWFANNLLGIAFSIQGITLIDTGSFRNAAILLSGLFFYDIFWVFGTDVMVTVAKSFKAPIKLLFPRPTNKPSMLGLGDIVIPGILIALMMRFDLKTSEDNYEENDDIPSPVSNNNDTATSNVSIGNMPRPYFWTCLASYAIGLAITFFVMFHFEAAQPALLYLVPCCLGSVMLLAVIKGDFSRLFSFSTSDEDKEHEP